MEGFGEVFDLLVEPFWAGIILNAFSVAVPEFNVISWKDFDEAAGVVVLKLGDPSHFEVDFCLVFGDAIFRSWGEDILGGLDFECHCCLLGVFVTDFWRE